MTTKVLSPAEEAFVELSNHCVSCPECRPDPDRPNETRDCPTAAALHRAWRDLWNEEGRS